MKVLTLATLLVTSSVVAGDFRSIDGTDNNTDNPTWGQANSELLRLVVPAYNDGLSVPRGGDPSSLPSARAISNAVSDQSGSVPKSAHATDWIWQWGQFIDHDLDLTGAARGPEMFNIPILSDDTVFTTPVMEMNRSKYRTDSSGVRQQVNEITSYLDGSMVYGSDLARATALRTSDRSGKLNTTGNGSLLPLNTGGLFDNANAGPKPDDQLFLAGDIRANEQIALTATHTLFVREHNRLAEDIGNRLAANDTAVVDKFLASSLTEEQFIYETSRKIVGAEIQLITYNEFLPVLLGDNALDAFTGYKKNVNAGISNEFSTEAYRLHSLLSSELQRVNDDGSPAGSIPLANAFFDPAEITANGIETLLKGLASQAAEENDTLLVEDVRNMLFGPPGVGLDLAALDIQRARDHGLASLNDFRELYFGTPNARYGSYLEMTGGDIDLAQQFESVYGIGAVDDVDLWIGASAEPHVNGGIVGETFSTILTDQFERTRDGDRFFFLNETELQHLNSLYPMFLEETSLANIIRRNTDITNIQDNVFVLANHGGGPGHVVPLPAAVWVALPILGTLGVIRSMRQQRTA